MEERGDIAVRNELPARVPIGPDLTAALAIARKVEEISAKLDEITLLARELRTMDVPEIVKEEL